MNVATRYATLNHRLLYPRLIRRLLSALKVSATTLNALLDSSVPESKGIAYPIIFGASCLLLIAIERYVSHWPFD